MKDGDIRHIWVQELFGKNNYVNKIRLELPEFLSQKFHLQARDGPDCSRAPGLHLFLLVLIGWGRHSRLRMMMGHHWRLGWTIGRTRGRRILGRRGDGGQQQRGGLGPAQHEQIATVDDVLEPAIQRKFQNV